MLHMYTSLQKRATCLHPFQQVVTVPVSVQWPVVDASLREQRTRQVYIHFLPLSKIIQF